MHRHPPHAILATVCRRTGVPMDDLTGYYRSPKEVRARELATVLLRVYGGLSFPEIAVCMGRSPSSHSGGQDRYARCIQRASTDHEFGELLASLSAEFDPDIAAWRERYAFENIHRARPVAGRTRPG